MKLKLIVALVNDDRTDAVVDAARAAGATGATVITGVRGEGLKPAKTFLGLDLTTRRNVLLFLVSAARAGEILAHIAAAGRFDKEPGAGIAFDLAIEDVVGLSTQLPSILEEDERRGG